MSLSTTKKSYPQPVLIPGMSSRSSGKNCANITLPPPNGVIYNHHYISLPLLPTPSLLYCFTSWRYGGKKWIFICLLDTLHFPGYKALLTERYCYSHLADEECEASRGKVICPRSQS